MSQQWRKFCLICLITCTVKTNAQSISIVTGSDVEIKCNYRVPSNGYIIWMNSTLRLSLNTQITDHVPKEIRERLNISGNHDDGEYNLMIYGVKKTDEGHFRCYVYGDASRIQSQQLLVIGSNNKQNNKLLGTEGQDLLIRCTANGGDPAPNMVLMVGSENYTSRNSHNIERVITHIVRSYDDVTVTCQAVYDGVNYTSPTDTAVIRLYLKPLQPSFNINPVVTENTKILVITCTSTGSRPSPTDRIWLIGNSNVDITSSSTVVYASTPDDTYTATSTLTYKVPKVYNQQNLTCGFKSTATGNDYETITNTINVLYAPTVSVQYRTFPLTQTVREVYCNIDGNPNSTFIKWQHKSMYGELIREFFQGSTLILPKQDQAKRYQDTGKYVCITSNEIGDENGNLNQTASGYVISTAPPMFALYNSWTQVGDIRKTVNISIDVYSVPPPSNFVWYREETPVSGSGYKTSSSQANVKVMFYGQEVEVNVYRSTLTIADVQDSDFAAYKLTVLNSHGSVEHIILFNFSSPPKKPKNLTVICQTDQSLTIQWLAGYDGGYEQTFYIMYSQQGTGRWTTVMGPKGVRGGTGQIHQTVIGANYVSALEVERDIFKGAATGISVITVISIVINLIFTYKSVSDRRKPTEDQPCGDTKDLECYDNIPETVGPPKKPKNLTVICQTDQSLTIQWLARYDGGYEQTFYIMYSQQGTGRWTTVTGPKGVRGGTGQIHQTVIGGLQHSTVYELQMFAQNKINRSDETTVETGTTLSRLNANYVSALEVERDIFKGAATGISVITVISFVINLIFTYKSVSDRRKPTEDQPCGDTKDLECYDNIPETVGESSLVDSSNYENLGSKDKPNEYEELSETERGAESNMYSNTSI